MSACKTLVVALHVHEALLDKKWPKKVQKKIEFAPKPLHLPLAPQIV